MLLRFLTGVCFAVLAASASADDQDLIIMMSIATDKPLTPAEIIGQIDDAVPNRDLTGISAEPVPRRVYDLFAKIIGNLDKKPFESKRVSEVEGDINKWHIDGYGVGKDTPDYAPDWVVLKWSEFAPDGAVKQHVQEFPVTPPVSTDTQSVAQALGNKKILIRADETWELNGFRLEWNGPNGTRIKDPPEDLFAEWSPQPPCFLVVIPNFDQYGVPVSKVYDALREKTSEPIIVSSPKRPIKLVSMNIDPVGQSLGELSFEKYYTLRVSATKDNQIALAPHVWALFPLTTENKDLFLKQILDVERASANVTGAGGRAVPRYILESRGNEGSPKYISVAEPLEKVSGLTLRNMPQPTAILDPSLQPHWYEVPAVADAVGKVDHYARTFRLDGPAGQFGEEQAWVIVAYARPDNPDANVIDWRAGKINTAEPGGDAPEYAKATDNPFPRFLESLSQNPAQDLAPKEKGADK